MQHANSTSLVPFNFNGKQLRSVTRDGEPWFVAADICKHLELENVTQALTRLDDDEKSTLISNEGPPSGLNIVSESGLYSLTLASRKPEAKAFKKWVTAEVLPSIRKTGSYSVAPAADPLATLPAEQRALVALMVEQAELKQRQAITEDKVARIEAKQQAFEEGSKFFTVIGYAVWKGLPNLSLTEAASLGRAAAKLSKERGVLVDRVRDPRFGVINSYHEDILADVFNQALEG